LVTLFRRGSRIIGERRINRQLNEKFRLRRI
jgi:hypothetical protein